MSKEMAVVKQKETALAQPLEFSNDQVRILAETVAKGADQNELAFFLNVCKMKRLDPFGGQVHCVKRWDSDLGKNKMAIQIGIDGFRVIAARTGEHAGTSEPEFDSEEGTFPNWARVTVYRYGRGDEKIPYTAKVRYTEYVVTKRDGNPNIMWANKAYTMLGKCAEAQALRKAFPDELSGMYSEEEMGQADNPTDSDKSPKQPVSMPKSIDEKKHQTVVQPAQTTTVASATTKADAPKAQTQADPQEATPRAKVEEISGVIEQCQVGKGNMEGCLFIIVDKKIICVSQKKVNAEMVVGAKVTLKIIPNIGAKTFNVIEVLKVQPAVVEGEVIDAEFEEVEPEQQSQDDAPQDMSGLFADPGPAPQSSMEPEPSTATRKGTIGVKRAQRLYALRGQNEKATGLTEAKMKEILHKLPMPIEHLRDLETSFYGTFEQIVTGEEDWRPYLD